ncbi:MAG TPA: 50S ribosomal protein L9, partial [Aggregatilineales bacterium]|nr:50S ribosomal protein L9 [Aggregatilineales bacterium]HQE18011.1 50S ribosomal protein L9 [Aggregatilineales bacterium]
MKVILLEDVYNQGVAGDVVDVAPGFARNYLIPKQLAVKATPGALKQLETLRANAAKRRAELEGRMEQVAQQIEGLTLYFPVKASERGKLFGSVTTQEIAERLKEEIGLEIDPRRVGDNPLRELGKFDVPVRLETGLVANVRVVVHR